MYSLSTTEDKKKIQTTKIKLNMHVAYVYESCFLQIILVFHFEQVSFTCFVC